MWRLFHRLFGWHYILYKDSATKFIIRVKKSPNGTLYIRDWTGIYCHVLEGNGKFVGKEAYDPYPHYTPLTFTEENSND